MALASAVREGEHRVAWTAFALLFLLLGAHAMLETARDALFLSSIPATRLPFVYILVAVVSLGVLRLQRVVGHTGGRYLPAYLVGASALTAGLWQALPALGNPGLYVLYVWSGVMISLLIVEFWLAMGAKTTVAQAKRLFPFIGTGSVAGAIFGFGVAGGIASTWGAFALLPAACALLLTGGVLSMMLRGPDEASADPEQSAAAPKTLRELCARPYVRGIAGLALVTSVTVTVADYIFKSTMAAEVDPAELGAWFAGVYLVLNIAALVVQLAVTGPLVRRLGVTRSMAVLPLALSLGALGSLFGLGLVGAIALKGADGTLRHTVLQTARELLFVPLPSRIREQVKAMIDVVGQRGGQAVASVAILGLAAVDVDLRALGGVLLVLIVAWVVLARRIQEPYLAVFRRTLSQLATSRQLDYPELDVASLETLIQSLNSTDPDRVLAALEVLEQKEKSHLVPVLLLYHPASEVVVAVLWIFVRAGRTDFLPIAEQLQGNANPTVHAALVRARAAVAPDVDYLRQMRVSHCRATRTTAVAYLHSLGAEDEEATRQAFDELRNHENRFTAEKAIAEAAYLADTPLTRSLLIELSHSDNVEVADLAIVGMGEIASPDFLPVLVELLRVRTHRQRILEILPSFGEEAVAFLSAALLSASDPGVTREVPRALGQFAPLDAVPALLGGLDAADGLVKYRIIRELERMMRAMPMLAESLQGWGPETNGRATIDAEIASTVGTIFKFIDRRLVLVAGAAKVESRNTDEHKFLVRLLRDKEKNAEERLVRLIGLMHPEEDFGVIWRGLKGSGRIRSSSLELLDHLLVAPLREPIAAMFDAVDDETKLLAGRDFYTPASRAYADVLEVLVESSSESLSALAVAQVGALKLTDLRPKLMAIPSERPMVRDVVVRALALLTASPSEAPS